MNHIYLGSRGDYGGMYTYAHGYIDNVRLTKPGPAVTPEPTFGSPAETTTTVVTTKKTPALPTANPTSCPRRPPSLPDVRSPAVLALGIIGTCFALRGMKKY